MRYLIARLRARLGRAGQPEPSRPVERSAADIADQHHADATAAAELAAIRDQLDQIQPLVRGCIPTCAEERLVRIGSCQREPRKHRTQGSLGQSVQTTWWAYPLVTCPYYSLPGF